jgi:hypothetical protein
MPELSKLVQLILGVVVECERKVEYIPNIMKLDPASQRELMVLIEGVSSAIQFNNS